MRLFVSYDNADRKGSLEFGHLLGKALQTNGLKYTPHYTQALMGHYRRELVDADAGVYRFDQLVVLKMTRMPAVLLEAGSIINRQEEPELADAGATHQNERSDRLGGRRLLRGPHSAKNCPASETAGTPHAKQSAVTR